MKKIVCKNGKVFSTWTLLRDMLDKNEITKEKAYWYAENDPELKACLDFWFKE